MSAMTLSHGHLASLDQQAHQFQRNTNLALEAGALRRLQWAAFTASRKVESADALWARNRDQHIKQMLRHWAAQTATRRAAGAETGDVSEVHDNEPESPSLRPASRAATRDLDLPSSPPTQADLGTTPSYLRTPTRHRRAGRFRPLPTPAPFTPLAFDSGLLTSTPAPVVMTGQIGSEERQFEGTVTPFSRKLGAAGLAQAAPASALRSSVFQRSVQPGTGKSVRFAGSGRFGKKTFGEGSSS